jgi:hypothetical protein
LARAVLLSALVLGATADAFMHGIEPGLGLGLWTALLALDAVALVWRAGRSATPQTLLWLAAATGFAFATAWRNAEVLQAFDLLATVACLTMAAVCVRDRGAALFARRLRDTVLTTVDVVRGVVVGMLPLAFREAVSDHSRTQAAGRARTLLRPAAIVIVALLVFGSLLRDADPIFASVFSVPSWNLDELMSHVVVAGFFAWIVAGWARAALASNAEPHRAPAELPIRLAAADVTAALGTLVVLFAAFIATQVGWLFGGEHFLRARTGLTAAEYARHGFFQMVWIVTLVVPIIVGTRAAVGSDRVVARRHTALSIPLVALLGAIIVSAMLRLRMYVHYYGLTTERFYPMVFMLWLATVVVWLAATVLRGWGRPFVAGTVISGLATLAVLNVVDPDAIVARVDVDRAAVPASMVATELDLSHLAQLRGAGVEIATRAILRSVALPDGSRSLGSGQRTQQPSDRCVAARTLVDRFGSRSRAHDRAVGAGAWRFWNRDDRRALDIVAKNEAALLGVVNASCAASSNTLPTAGSSSGNSRT